MSIGNAARGQAPFPESSRENVELRTRPYIRFARIYSPYEAPCQPLVATDAAKGGLPSALVANTPPPRKQTDGLEIGTQARFLAAAARAAALGHPLNALLTVRWRTLFSDGDMHPLRAMDTPERIRHLVELLRKWLTRCGAPAHYIWVRETSDIGEHWHLGLHCPPKKRKALENYLETLLGEPLAPCPRTSAQGRTEGEVACSAFGSWHLAKDTHPEREGYFIAAYLGKGEPSQRMFRGQLVNNSRKRVRGRRYGGTIRDNRYDVEQGDIVGTTARKGRFDIARALK